MKNKKIKSTFVLLKEFILFSFIENMFLLKQFRLFYVFEAKLLFLVMKEIESKIFVLVSHYV